MSDDPVFARPPCVIQFSSKREFFAFLKKHHVPYETWGDKERRKIWKEVQEGDAVYSIDPSFERMHVAVRCVMPIAARIAMMHPEFGTLVLVEFVRNGDFFEPRQQKESSLSEKMLLNPATGEPIETPVETIVRCLRQEAGVIVSEGELSEGSITFLPRTSNVSTHLPAQFRVRAEGVELDFSPTTKFPGLQTYRQVAHYSVYLHHRHYWCGGHRDPDTKYYSFWRSVHEQGIIEPIPVRLVALVT